MKNNIDKINWSKEIITPFFISDSDLRAKIKEWEQNAEEIRMYISDTERYRPKSNSTIYDTLLMKLDDIDDDITIDTARNLIRFMIKIYPEKRRNIIRRYKVWLAQQYEALMACDDLDPIIPIAKDFFNAALSEYKKNHVKKVEDIFLKSTLFCITERVERLVNISLSEFKSDFFHEIIQTMELFSDFLPHKMTELENKVKIILYDPANGLEFSETAQYAIFKKRHIEGIFFVHLMYILHITIPKKSKELKRFQKKIFNKKGPVYQITKEILLWMSKI